MLFLKFPECVENGYDNNKEEEIFMDNTYTYQDLRKNALRFRPGDKVLIPEGISDGNGRATVATVRRIKPHLIEFLTEKGIPFTMDYLDCMDVRIIKPVPEVTDDILMDIATAFLKQDR